MKTFVVSLIRQFARQKQWIHSLLMWLVPLVGSIFAILLYNWQTDGLWPILLMLAMFTLTMLSITVGFHRLFAHTSFEAHPLLRLFFGIFGSMAFQGPLIYWVANHRRHHHCSDRAGDLHSPHTSTGKHSSTFLGFLHAHFLWSFDHELTDGTRYARNLYRDTVARSVNRYYYWCVIAGFLLPGFIGFLCGGNLRGLLLGILWGGCVRLLISNNTTAAINSVTHLWGRARFNTGDKSVNVVWLALPTFGESWHNNHHRFPSSAIFGLLPGEIDLGGMLIRGLEVLGGVTDVKRPSKKAIRTASQSFVSRDESEL